jgi:hypothetical protein
MPHNTINKLAVITKLAVVYVVRSCSDSFILDKYACCVCGDALWGCLTGLAREGAPSAEGQLPFDVRSCSD